MFVGIWVIRIAESVVLTCWPPAPDALKVSTLRSFSSMSISILSSISGYSGGHLKNPKYEDVIYKDTGHVEVIEVTYDPSVVSYKDLLNVYWKNIDPFDASGQFCDKGKSYRSVIFFEDKSQKELIDKSFKEIEKKFDKKIVTLVWKFDIFYPAENYHQDYYEKNFIRYLMYKNACKREETLKKIWN